MTTAKVGINPLICGGVFKSRDISLLLAVRAIVLENVVSNPCIIQLNFELALRKQPKSTIIQCPSRKLYSKVKADCPTRILGWKYVKSSIYLTCFKYVITVKISPILSYYPQVLIILLCKDN